MRAPVAAAILCTSLAAAACSKSAQEPLTLDRNMLTVENTTNETWNDVEIWLNTYYRATAPFIAAHGRFQAPLDGFVAGFGQRFDYRRMQVHDLRLTAKLPDGKPLEIKKEFAGGGLAGALGGKK
jgi:hypothetical protein